MESRKMVLGNLFAGQRWRHRHKDRLMDKGQEEKGEGEVNGECSVEERTLPYVK